MKIAHISDVHFGTHSQDKLKALSHALFMEAPDLLIISGDFTQVGNIEEFKMAQDFIKSMPFETLCCPGNHDISLKNIFERFFRPFFRYEKYICKDTEDFFENDLVKIATINSARPILFHWNWANGAINKKQLKRIGQFFEGHDEKYKFCVFHHPLHNMHNSPISVKTFGAQRAMAAFKKMGINFILNGHLHKSIIERVDNINYIIAASALSYRLRNAPNGFGIFEISKEKVILNNYIFDGKYFTKSEIIDLD